jgi:potassium channel subfamily K
MGDTIVKGIRDLTLWIGTVTVLPGEMGVRDAVRSTAKKNFKRHRSSSSDGSDVEEQAPGFLGETERRASVSSASKSNNIKKWNKNNPESAGQRAAGENAKLRKLDGERRRDEVPRGQRHYHTILIREIGELHGDLRSSPPRKYGYEEWAWYLRLLGRDEADAEGHPKASGRAGGDGNENENGQDDSKNNRGSEIANRRNEEAETREWNWSWMDQRSPLMGEKEEAEWILERLTRKLEEELEELRREEERESERKDEDKWIGQ